MPTKKPKVFSEILWSQLRGLYGSGLFSGIKEMYPHAKRLYKQIPSLTTIEQKAANEKWKKNLFREQMDAAQERSFQKMFEEKGLGDEEMVQKIVDGVKHSDMLVDKALNILRENNGALDDKTVQALRDAVADLRVTHKFIAERNKLTGSYSAAKLREAGGGEGRLKMESGPESIEEMMAEHERLVRSLED